MMAMRHVAVFLSEHALDSRKLRVPVEVALFQRVQCFIFHETNLPHFFAHTSVFFVFLKKSFRANLAKKRVKRKKRYFFVMG